MHIHGTHHVHGPHGVNAPHAAQQGTAAAKPTTSMPATDDQVEISPAAQAAIQAAESGEIRQALVDKIRAEIAAGTYETADKLDKAVDRLLDEIG